MKYTKTKSNKYSTIPDYFTIFIIYVLEVTCNICTVDNTVSCCILFLTPQPVTSCWWLEIDHSGIVCAPDISIHSKLEHPSARDGC